VHRGAREGEVLLAELTRAARAARAVSSG
jgi:hypothetical protein